MPFDQDKEPIMAPPPQKPSLRELLDTLPAELYHDMYDLTLTIEPATLHINRATYRVPAVLQVDSISRKQSAKSYYVNTTFYLEGPALEAARTLDAGNRLCYLSAGSGPPTLDQLRGECSSRLCLAIAGSEEMDYLAMRLLRTGVRV
ncbi:hypothetical protein Slin15195_G106440 [Septoria linicola]|uniref:Uncharacterized protein n=1 Tax=Septoria linicola TaxID=215465 RepID=A0A9Q9B352_9PEZI|nr:hypothetical protein Slin15195_G106440 [Septoria linicola]